MIGAGGVGKTCIARRLCYDTFNLNTQLTVGIDFYSHDVPIMVNGEESFVRLSIWDFGGQDRFRTLFRSYIGGANGIFLVFDLLQIQSLINLDWWYDKLKKHNVIQLPKILIGTKYDLIEEDESYSGLDETLINEHLERYSIDQFYKTSSKDNVNIRLIFKEITKEILDFRNLSYEKLL